MKERLIEEAWMLLAEKLDIKPQSGPYIDMRNSFFAGAYTIMTIMRSLGANYTEDEAINIIEIMHQECSGFIAEVTYDPEQN